MTTLEDCLTITNNHELREHKLAEDCGQEYQATSPDIAALHQTIERLTLQVQALANDRDRLQSIVRTEQVARARETTPEILRPAQIMDRDD